MVTGGHNYDFSLDSTELYDPSTGHWRVSGPLPSAREGLIAATMDYRVLVFLGDTVLEFDQLGETFTEVGHISQDHGENFGVSVIELSDYLEWCAP